MWLLLADTWGAPLDAVAALGTQRLTDVQELRFTMNKEQQGHPAVLRTWIWRPNDGVLTRIVDGERLSFRMGAPVDGPQRRADAEFIEDSFWLAPQMHLQWAAASLVVSDEGQKALPIGHGYAHKLVVNYPNTAGGYTPGDSYDLYLDSQGRVLAFTYRQGGSPAEPLTASFSSYSKMGPLELATERHSVDGTLHIRFSELGLTLAPGLTWIAPMISGREGESIVEIDSSRCRLRTVDVPLDLGARLPATSRPVPSREDVFDAAFVIREGDSAQHVRYSTRSLTLESPQSLQLIGLQRCKLGALGAEAISAMLDGSTPEHRALLLTLGLETWLPSRSSLLQKPLRALASRCARTGDCAALVALAKTR